ncbi:hypothetical protein BD413DRAFT_558874 [Trametes elegans]|nr:hypothetical protein BD413DRAFT_558874 [Trametes elegans]
MVAFAACILEFPVAYVPTSGENDGPFLAGVPLDVYEGVLEANTSVTPVGLPGRHILIKFSCPQHIGRGAHNFRPEAVVSGLKGKLDERLRSAAFPGTVTVKHYTETLDRVAL